MALWVCSACTATYSVGAPRCPQCGSAEHVEDNMPKIHADGSVTDASAPVEPVLEAPVDEPAVEPAPVDEPPAAASRRPRPRATPKDAQ